MAGLISETEEPCSIVNPRFTEGPSLGEKRGVYNIALLRKSPCHLLVGGQAPCKTTDIRGGLICVGDDDYRRASLLPCDRFEQNSELTNKSACGAARRGRGAERQHRPLNQAYLYGTERPQLLAFRLLRQERINCSDEPPEFFSCSVGVGEGTT